MAKPLPVLCALVLDCRLMWLLGEQLIRLGKDGEALHWLQEAERLAPEQEDDIYPAVTVGQKIRFLEAGRGDDLRTGRYPKILGIGHSGQPRLK